MAERPEACAAWREDIAAWVVAQITPDREAALAHHVAGCTTCRDEADGLLAVAAVALGADPDRPVAPRPAVDEAPPADLSARIAARIDAERSHGRGRVVLAAAVLLVVIGGLVAITRDAGEAELDGTEFAFTLGEGRALVAPDPDTGGSIVELVATDLDPTMTYALWLSVPGGGRDERVPAGTFRCDEDGDVDVRLMSSLPAEDTGRVWATATDVGLVLDTVLPG